ncbi:TolC family protein [Changchengzhania lutea]|uniref:TolC family protein n=1 Tax=Changchengzhania lutea TaxID=2049305 RepID=UPI001C8F9FD5|nr:TolC family protein [Changchengzhania lutea]
MKTMMNKNDIKSSIKYYSITISLLCSVSVTFGQQKTWSLQECVNHALEHNISVQQGVNTILINEQDIIASRGQFLPSLSASAAHNITIGGLEIDPGVFVDQTFNQSRVGISVSQNIFNGFRTLNLYKQSQLTKETNALELDRIKDDISLNVVNAYLNVLFNRENLETALAQFEFSEKQLKQVTNLVDAGVQPRANIYDAEATLSRDEQSVTIAENNLNLALLNLSQLLQVPYEGFAVEGIDLNEPSEALLYKDFKPILNYALENRVEIKVAEKGIENAELNTEISKSGYFPTLNFTYGYSSRASYTNLTDLEASFFDQINDNKGHSFGLNLNIPIFSRFQNKTAVAKSKIQEDNSRLNLAQQKLNIESNIQRTFTDAQAAFRAFEAAKKSLEAQELAFNNSKERFNLGAMTAFELEQARVALINAQSSLINAKYDFVFKTKVLDFYMGKSLTN